VCNLPRSRYPSSDHNGLNIFVNGIANCEASSFKTCGWIPCGPGDFELLSSCNSFLTRSLLMSGRLISCSVFWNCMSGKLSFDLVVDTLAKKLDNTWTFSWSVVVSCLLSMIIDFVFGLILCFCFFFSEGQFVLWLIFFVFCVCWLLVAVKASLCFG